jgi:hypothetical protein
MSMGAAIRIVRGMMGPSNIPGISFGRVKFMRPLFYRYAMAEDCFLEQKKAA